MRNGYTGSMDIMLTSPVSIKVEIEIGDDGTETLGSA
jgi:hypothetical protein